MQFWEKCSILLQKHSKDDPDQSEMEKIQIPRFSCKHLKFLRSFHRWKNGNVQQRTNALSRGFLKVNCSSTKAKQEPQNDSKMVEKANFWQLFEKLVNFYQNLKLTKTS